MPNYYNPQYQPTGMNLFDIGANEQGARNAYGAADTAYDAVNPTVGYQQQGATEFGGIQEDPRLRQMQMQALGQMQGISQAGGRDAQFNQGMNQAAQAGARQEQSQRAALQQAALQRGQYGGGQQFAQQLQAQQSGADRAGNQGFDTAAAAQQRALAAMQGYGQGAGQLRGQDYSQAAQKAQAQDIINSANTRGTNQQNQQNFQNTMGLQGARYGAANAAGNRMSGNARQAWGDMGNLVQTVGNMGPVRRGMSAMGL